MGVTWVWAACVSRGCGLRACRVGVLAFVLRCHVGEIYGGKSHNVFILKSESRIIEAQVRRVRDGRAGVARALVVHCQQQT